METRPFSGNDRMDTKFLAATERKGHKRKLADTNLVTEPQAGGSNTCSLSTDVRAHVEILKASISASESDRLAARKAAHALADFAKQGMISLI